jgi:hypothetical protein
MPGLILVSRPLCSETANDCPTIRWFSSLRARNQPITQVSDRLHQAALWKITIPETRSSEGRSLD